jgi:hypothetical protein
VKATLRPLVAAAMLLVPAAASFVAQPALAATAQPRISSMNVNSDAGLSPGATLRLSVAATPNAGEANVTLGDSGVTVPLHQQSAGSYTGSYTLRRGDHIDPMQRMRARLAFGDRVVAREFNYPPAFQALAMGAAPVAAQNPAIERFVMRSEGRIEPGTELRFRLTGAPGADAWLDIPGVIRGVDLSEVRPGVYEGSYVVRRRDNLDAFRNAVATLRSGNQRATARVDLRDGDRESMGRDEHRDERMDRDEHRRDERGDRYGAAPANLPLQITAPGNNMSIDANGNVAIQGRTAPYANVRVQVETVANVAGLIGLTQPVADLNVQADRNGFFAATVPPRPGIPLPGTRFDVHVTATSGGQTSEARLSLVQRQG